jgi:hypothetical protein
MKSIFNKTNTSVLALCLTMSFNQVNAAIITFGGQTATDGSVVTSAVVGDSDWTGLIGSNVINSTSGFFIETFDENTANADLPVGALFGGQEDIDSNQIGIETNGCSINSYGALSFSGTAGGLGVRQGNTGYAAHNNANSTCFGFTPQQGFDESDIVVDYSTFLGTLGPLGAGGIDYFGIYFGSIDTYNFFEFGNIVGGDFVGTALTNFGNGDSILDGQEIINEFFLQSGNRDTSNRYMNIAFGANEEFTAFRMKTTSRALEVDNIVVGLANRVGVNRIPEPTTITIFALGLFGLVLRKKVR